MECAVKASRAVAWMQATSRVAHLIRSNKLYKVSAINASIESSVFVVE